MSQMTVFESYWSESMTIPDDYLDGLDMKAIYEIRGHAIGLMKRARTIDRQHFFEEEAGRLLEIIKERIEVERQMMLGGKMECQQQ